ncbi:MAG: GDP-mannose 4,6-dehydratase [Oscillospiraceae bacterium]|nr:GDP-mannose 4,6-dehydratase [Oscillospiraceae bacterium]
MRALVTGGAGFIGSNVAALLLEKGWQVTVLDNLSTGNMQNLESYECSDNFKFIKGDVCNPSDVGAACSGVNVVFHLAACVGRQKSLDNPVLDSSTNLIGTINILEQMHRQGIKRIVYSSSAAIFGEPLTSTIDESHPQNADSPYGVSKLAAEKMILAYSGIYGIEAVCLRYFNIYGINQRFDLYGNVIPIFAKRLYAGEPITIYGDGSQTRDFVNVHDVARANYLAGICANGTGVYNLGSGTGITIQQLAGMMTAISKREVEIQYAPERPADVKHCRADARKANAELGFTAQVPLETGLKEYLQWFLLNCVD